MCWESDLIPGAWELEQQTISKRLPNDSGSGKPRVAVCIPHVGEWSAEWSDRVHGVLRYVPDSRFDKLIFPVKGVTVDIARDVLVLTALKDPLVTHIFFQDSDVVYEKPNNPNEAIWQLLQCNAPICSGVYRAIQMPIVLELTSPEPDKLLHSYFNYAMWMKSPNGFTPIQKWTGNWLKVDVIGMGCCLLQRQVFEKVPYPWFIWGSGKDSKDEKDRSSPSEDFNFCLNAAERGFETRVFTEIQCSHLTGKLKIKFDGTVTTQDV